MGSCLGQTLPCLPTYFLSENTQRSYFWHHATDEQRADLISNADNEPQKHKNSFIFGIINYKAKRKSVQFLDRFMERQKGKYAKLSNQFHEDSLNDIRLQNLDVNNLLNSPDFTKESNMNYTVIVTQNASRTSSILDLEWEHEYGSLRSYNPSTQLTYEGKEVQTNIVKGEEKENEINSIHELLESKFLDDLDTIIYDADSLSQVKPSEKALKNSRLMRVYSECKKVGSFSRTSSHASWSYNSTPESLEWDVDEEQQKQLYEEDDRLDHETLKLLHQIEQLKNQVLNETGELLCESKGLVLKAKSMEPLHGGRSEIMNIS